jgi:hypothetical protein
MFDGYDKESAKGSERLFSLRRIMKLLIGSVAALLVGAMIVSLITYSRYGGTPFDRLIGREKNENPHQGKLAFDKGTKFYIGIIKSEGYSQRRGNVYYIEQPGGSLVEIAKERVEVREPGSAPPAQGQK